MNKQRKVLITITYNEMGIIIDTKAEEVAQPDLQQTCNQLATDYISRQAARDALWKAMYEYEDKMEKQFIESYDLDIEDWIQHRIFVQNMSDIDRQTILELPSAHPEPQWIPCSERLPEKIEKSYWVCTDSGYQCSCKWKKYLGKGKDIWTWHLNAYVVAWMPLPEPYKEKDNERA